MVRVGQTVKRIPKTIGVSDSARPTVLEVRPLDGTVIYVHPEGRFHVVEFQNRMGGVFRETFYGVED